MIGREGFVRLGFVLGVGGGRMAVEVAGVAVAERQGKLQRQRSQRQPDPQPDPVAKPPHATRAPRTLPAGFGDSLNVII